MFYESIATHSQEYVLIIVVSHFVIWGFSSETEFHKEGSLGPENLSNLSKGTQLTHDMNWDEYRSPNFQTLSSSSRVLAAHSSLCSRVFVRRALYSALLATVLAYTCFGWMVIISVPFHSGNWLLTVLFYYQILDSKFNGLHGFI